MLSSQEYLRSFCVSIVFVTFCWHSILGITYCKHAFFIGHVNDQKKLDRKLQILLQYVLLQGHILYLILFGYMI